MLSRSTEELESGAVQTCGVLLPAQILYLYSAVLQLEIGDAAVGSMVDTGIAKESFAIRGWNSVLELGGDGCWFGH
jgi:hypothetical protein